MGRVLVWWCTVWCLWAAGTASIASEGKEALALLCPLHTNSSQCLCLAHGDDEYLFSIYGKDVTVKYGPKYLKLSCPPGVSLESGVFPTFERPTAVPALTLGGCLPPADLAAVLVSLNILPLALTDLTLRALPALPTVQPSICRGLHLASLELSGGRVRSLVDQSALRDCNGLIALRLMSVRIEATALALVPVSLQRLALRGGSLDVLSPDILRRLPALERLEIQSDRLHTAPLAAALALRVAVFHAPLVALTVAPTLENVTLGGGAAAVSPVGPCHVRSLRLTGAVENATLEWLRRCDRLREVTWYCSPGGAAGRQVLPAAPALEELHVHRCRLDTVEGAWLRAAPALRTLDMSGSVRTSLPREALAWSGKLRSVSLRASGARVETVRALAAVEVALHELDLSENPEMGDLCAAAGDIDVNAASLLKGLHALRVLRLRRTAATRLCPDWRRDLPDLEVLDLRDNNISRLQGEDLQWSRASTSVELCGNPLETVAYSREQYRAALVAAPSRLDVHLCPPDSDTPPPPLRCDCEVYWFARALRDRPDHAPPALAELHCPGALLRDTPLDALTCPVPAPPCPLACRCTAAGDFVTVDCSRAELDDVPPLPRDLPVRELNLADNALTRLDLAALPANLTLLDLSHNRLDLAEAASALGATHRLRLAGNPLRCECAAHEAFDELMAAADRVDDWTSLRCLDGGLLAAAALCARPNVTAAYATLLGVCGLALLLLSVFLTSPTARRCIKVLLRGDRRAADAELEEDGAATSRYEAFVSFASQDAGKAAAVAKRLEANGRRLCLHHRDWAPGELITEQIARSVCDSRRTVALLSDAFLASAWARAEFRAAWALTQREHAPRLLLVLLPELSLQRKSLASSLPADLAAAVATCTYLEWDEPRFWERLERSVPLPPTAASTASLASPAPTADVERY